MRYVLAISLFAALAACENADDVNVNNAKAAVTSMLNDPSSAQWQDVDGSTLCVKGSVNAKNGFGGYVGFKSFYYNVQTKETGIDPGNSTDAELLLGMYQTHDALVAYSNGLQECLKTSTDALNAALKS